MSLVNTLCIGLDYTGSRIFSALMVFGATRRMAIGVPPQESAGW